MITGFIPTERGCVTFFCSFCWIENDARNCFRRVIDLIFFLCLTQIVVYCAPGTARIRNATMPVIVTTENVFAIENSLEKCASSKV